MEIETLDLEEPIMPNLDYRDYVDRINDDKHGYLGCNIKECRDDIIICEYIYLLKHVKDIREDYELCLLRNRQDYEKYNQEKTFEKYLCENAKLDDKSWLVDTEVYSGVANELIRRGYIEYLNILWNRYM